MLMRFQELSDEQRERLYTFLKLQRPQDELTYEAFIAYYAGELFDGGANFLIAFDKDFHITGCVGVITREIPVKGEAYIVRLHVNGDNHDAAAGLMRLAIDLCNGAKASRLLAGVAPADALSAQVAKENGFEERHRALILSLEVVSEQAAQAGRAARLTYRPVGESNRGAFRALHNDVFRFVPNGGAITDEEMDELVAKHAGHPEFLGLAYAGERLIGFYELELTAGEGWIQSIGIDPSCQGQGYGREMLLDLIAVLEREGVERVKLIVMSSNDPAISLYRAIGFGEERVLSVWYGRDCPLDGDRDR